MNPSTPSKNKILSLLVILLLALSSHTHAYQQKKFGFVLARGQELGPNGEPVLIEVNERGEELQEIGEVIGPLKGVQPYSAAAYRNAIQQYDQLITANRNGIARGAIILSTTQNEQGQSQYKSHCNGLPPINVLPQSPDALPIPKKIPCPDISNENIRSVLFRHPQTILDSDILNPNKGAIRVNKQWRLVFLWDDTNGNADCIYLDDHSYR